VVDECVDMNTMTQFYNAVISALYGTILHIHLP